MLAVPDLSQLISLVAALDQHPIGALMLLLLVCAVGGIAYLFRRR